MEIKINDYYEPDHFRAISEDNYNISRTCEYEKNEMHHIHNTSEILLVEDGLRTTISQAGSTMWIFWS